MPGNPKFRAFLVKMEERFEGERGFMEWIACGGKIPELAKAMEVSPQMIYKWLRKDTDRHQRFREARKLSATVLVDEALDLADNATPMETGLVREKIGIRKWLAERYDRDSFGSGPAIAANVTVNINDLHLEALRAPRSALPPSAIEDAEFEVVEGGNVFGELDEVMEAKE